MNKLFFCLFLLYELLQLPWVQPSNYFYIYMCRLCIFLMFQSHVCHDDESKMNFILFSILENSIQLMVSFSSSIRVFKNTQTLHRIMLILSKVAGSIPKSTHLLGLILENKHHQFNSGVVTVRDGRKAMFQSQLFALC